MKGEVKHSHKRKQKKGGAGPDGIENSRMSAISVK